MKTFFCKIEFFLNYFQKRNRNLIKKKSPIIIPSVELFFRFKIRYKKEVKMIAPYFPAILIPIIGIFLPGIAMGVLFVYIEKETVE